MSHVNNPDLPPLRRVAILSALILVPCLAAVAALMTAGSRVDPGITLPLQSAGPFAGMLASIALLPLISHKFWTRNYGRVSLFWALMTALPFIAVYQMEAADAILHVFIADYFPFIILLWGLYVVTGGVVVRGTLVGTPGVNTLILLVGTVLASWIGTTGASILLIRPLLRAIAHREAKTHTVVFFIFLVSNIGGALSPLGDPPLFIGFLHGVPFLWTLNMLPHVLFTSGTLLALYYAVDRYHYIRESTRFMRGVKSDVKNRIRISGSYNLILLLGIAGAVLMSGTWKPGIAIEFNHSHIELQNALRDAAILGLGLLSLWFTPWRYRHRNGFTWASFREVGVLFAGIFVTIVPILLILGAGDSGALGFLVRLSHRSESGYFWATGSLSGLLDNTPTYLAFFSSVLGKLGLSEAQIHQALSVSASQWPALGLDVEKLVAFEGFLKAITAGAVFMGAMTYIGNAPNFMVKSIAEENKVPMPHFFGYMLYSIGILVPLFLVLNMLFFN